MDGLNKLAKNLEAAPSHDQANAVLEPVQETATPSDCLNWFEFFTYP
jgi:hypothetical protein